VSDGRLKVAHANKLLELLAIKLHKKLFLLDMGKLCSKFCEDRPTNNVTFLSTDAGRTYVYMILYSLAHCIGQTIIMAYDPKKEDDMNKINYKMHDATHCFLYGAKKNRDNGRAS